MNHLKIVLFVAGSILFCLPSNQVFANLRLKEANFSKNVGEGHYTHLTIVLESPIEEGPYEISVPERLGLENLAFVRLKRSQNTNISTPIPQAYIILIYKLKAIQRGTGFVLPFNILYRKTNTSKWATLSVPGKTITILGEFDAIPWKTVGYLFALLVVVFAWRKILMWGTKLYDPKDNVLTDSNSEQFIYRGDPEQATYQKATRAISAFDPGYHFSELPHILAVWDAELKEVIMTCYDISLSSSETETNTLLKSLETKKISAEELKELKNLLLDLRRLKSSSRFWENYHNLDIVELRCQIEKLHQQVLNYVQRKITS